MRHKGIGVVAPALVLGVTIALAANSAVAQGQNVRLVGEIGGG